MGLMPHGTDMPREWGEPGKRDNRFGVFGAFELGWQLTKGFFWRVLLVIIMLIIISLALSDDLASPPPTPSN